MNETAEKSVRVFAPASVANVGCGYDIFGFALAAPGDVVWAALRDEPGVHIRGIDGDDGRLPLDPRKNTAGVAVLELLRALNSSRGVALEISKCMPLGSGMGSSAASAAAAVFAANILLGEPLETTELLPFCLEAERVACGSGHVDNAAPSLLGGFVLVRAYDPFDVVSLPVPSGLTCVVLHPHLEINTGEARRMLPREIPLKDAVKQWGNVSGFTAGLLLQDLSLLSRSMEDFIVEPVRSALLPHYRETRKAAMDSGALGCGISGSGPSMFALTPSESCAKQVADVMKTVCKKQGIPCDLFMSPLPQPGPRVLGG